ncbi:HAD-IIA family hydrolase [Cohnella nanjingensis]|uniref:HAD-IIA family hydrolase n=1 Tax=Cohnella nanjingensis TaxID=1387779 RepID=A0A7X0RUX7_9BACL|nr:HAD-IIA family hydrolase [Cohnella nanjingensis]MBB6674060.1 HAD-IIA family hydrolase [Cohnella nanjingensis]
MPKLTFPVWLSDLDGTLYAGARAAPGAKEVLNFIRGSGRRVLFVTNNSRHSAREIGGKLKGLGIDARTSDIVAATDYTGRYLRERYGRLRLSVAGSPAFEQAHRLAGHTVYPLNGHAEIDAIVIGLDDAFSYERLEQIVHAVGKGAKLIAANGDGSHPGQDGRKVPETGALVAAVAAASGVRADYIGKPSPHLFRYALALGGASPAQTAMVGDNYGTDIAGGKALGLYTVWLRSSQAASALASDADTSRADLTVPHLLALYRLMGGVDE